MNTRKESYPLPRPRTTTVLPFSTRCFVCRAGSKLLLFAKPACIRDSTEGRPARPQVAGKSGMPPKDLLYWPNFAPHGHRRTVSNSVEPFLLQILILWRCCAPCPSPFPTVITSSATHTIFSVASNARTNGCRQV